MAIEILSSPNAAPDAGIFNLPAEFDTSKHAAQWVKIGNDVARAQQRQAIVGMNATADGWTVYKGDGGKPHKTMTAKGEYVLMFRPSIIQEQVNALYGNVGKKRIMAEKQQAATSAKDLQATGMLSDEQLRQAGYRDQEASQEGEVTLNEVELTPRVAVPPIEVET